MFQREFFVKEKMNTDNVAKISNGKLTNSPAAPGEIVVVFIIFVSSGDMDVIGALKIEAIRIILIKQINRCLVFFI